MNATRRIALTFLLMLSIPAQSLALALSECEQHQSRAAAVQHATDQTATEPDCMVLQQRCLLMTNMPTSPQRQATLALSSVFTAAAPVSSPNP